MKAKRKLLKIIFLSLFLFGLGASILCVSYYFASTSGTHLIEEKLNIASAVSYKLYDNNNNNISASSDAKTIKYEQLAPYTIDAFVCTEDKRFFEHHGIDYIRIAGAIKNNIMHPNNKQGGSTISQQVIKNTHLSREKTLARKLKEIKLALELEKKYSKKQILEIYLNSIYFGNGCYGIESASRYYFDKSPSELSVAESALLASTINAPSIYDPVSHADKAGKRKELVLKLMKNNKKISASQYENAISENIDIVKKTNKISNNYMKYAISEACDKLHITENQLSNMNAKIYTYFDQDIQKQVLNELSKLNIKNGKYASIVLDNKNKGVVAVASSKGFDPMSFKRQPGSLIKPILVYAPAFECGKYSPATFVNDTPVAYGNYEPENANKQYLGEVSVRTAIEKSLNIPAVKILDDIGIGYAKNYATNLGITFSKQDNNLALALGGFTEGLTLKQLADAYMCFGSMGEYKQGEFIDKIEQDGQILYERNNNTNKAVSSETSYLINNCLQGVAKTGTAKRLNLAFPVCSKTGTVGNTKGNTDAYNCAYTTKHTICTWIGTNNNNNYLPASINGATYPTQINSALFKNIYSQEAPNDFVIPEEVIEISLNDEALKSKKILADTSGTKKEYFSKKYLPQNVEENQPFVIEIYNFANSKPLISFDAKRAKTYQIYRKNGSNLQLLRQIEYYDGIFEFVDTSATSGQIYEYFAIENDNYLSRESNHIKLISS